MSFLSALNQRSLLSVFFLVAGALLLGTPAHSYAPKRQVQLPDECFPEKSAQAASKSQLKPPALQYHFGKRLPLLSDVEAQTIPLDAWNEFIRGPKTTWKLKPFRQGLYLSSKLSHAETFASNSDPWVIQVKLKEACLAPHRVGSVDFIQDPRFKIWFDSQKNTRLSYQDWVKQCYRPHLAIWSDRFVVEYYHSSQPENQCEQTLDAYFNELNFALVIDSVIPGSYALRDRSCIESVRGSALDIVDFYLTDQAWIDPCLRAGTHIDKLRLLAQALAHLSTSEARALASSKLTQLVKKMNRLPPAPFSIAERFKGLIRSFERCTQSNQLQEFRAQVQAADSSWVQERFESSALFDPDTEREISRAFEAICQPAK